MGSKGDIYDNALAETINGLYKAELIHRRAPWKTKESVEFAMLEWVSWFNLYRLLEPIGYIPPAEAEANYYRQLASQSTVEVGLLKPNSLRGNRGDSVLFWPALLALGGTKNQEAEYARIRGEHDALQQASIQKKCGMQQAKDAAPAPAPAPTPAKVEARQVAAEPEAVATEAKK